MAYSKQTWDTTSYVNPTRMNHIEEGIENADLTNKGIIIPNKTGTMALLGDFVFELLMNNAYIGTADTWVDLNFVSSIVNYKFIGFSFGRADNDADQRAVRIIIPTEAFKNYSTTSFPVVVIEDYISNSDTNAVLVAYKSDSSIYAKRGSNIFQYNRLSVFGILKP